MKTNYSGNSYFAYIIFIVSFLSIILKVQLPSYAKDSKIINLEHNTLVVLVLLEDLSSKLNKSGDSVELVVRDDVIVDNNALIMSGTKVIGKINLVREARILGEPGAISVVPGYVDAIDGQEVSLGGTFYAKGKSKEESTAILSGACCLIFALGRGEHALLVQGTELKAYVEKDYQIEVID